MKNEAPITQDTAKEKWLENIQQDSWQLELLVSGFVIFLMIGGLEPIRAFKHDIILLQQSTELGFLIDFFYSTLRVSYISLLCCMLTHLVLRGLWIAGVGLRSVSGEIDYESFRYQPKFIQRLRRRTGRFDDYLWRLERFCSVLFSLAFLIVFCFCSIITFTGSLLLAMLTYGYVTGNNIFDNPEDASVGVVVISNVFNLAGIIYCLDFITLGGLKRYRWIARPYYYLYVVMGWFTLARFYRPLYYNLIDNRFGRRLTLLVPVVIILFFLGTSLRQVVYPYAPGNLGDGTTWVSSRNYEDDGSATIHQLWRITLGSRYVQDNYVEAFVPYIPQNDDPVIEMLDSTLEVGRFSGFYFKGLVNTESRNNPKADFPRLLATFGQLHQVYVNDSLYALTPRFHWHERREQYGLLYLIPAHDLPPGEHALRFDRRMYYTLEKRYIDGRVIYFYK